MTSRTVSRGQMSKVKQWYINMQVVQRNDVNVVHTEQNEERDDDAGNGSGRQRRIGALLAAASLHPNAAVGARPALVTVADPAAGVGHHTDAVARAAWDRAVDDCHAHRAVPPLARRTTARKQQHMVDAGIMGI